MDNQFIQQCLFCEQKMSMTSLIKIALQYKYEYKIEIKIEDFIEKAKKKEIIQFYEKVYDHEGEYLQKQFPPMELYQKYKTLLHYYKYQVNTPRLHMKKVEKTIIDYQKRKKNLYYLHIKKLLGLEKSPPTLRIRTEPDKDNLVLFDLTKDEPSKSLISLLNLLNPETKKKVQIATQKAAIIQPPSAQTSARNRIVQKQLKAILTSDVIPKYQTTVTSRKSQLQLRTSTLKQNTFHSMKSPTIISNRTLTKMKSSPLISIPKQHHSQIQMSPKVNNLKNLRVLLQHKK